MADDNPSGNTPAPATTQPNSADGKQTPSQETQQGSVTLSKEQHDTLQRQAAQASEAQKRADILQKQADRNSKRKVENPAFEQTEVVEVKSRLANKLLTDSTYSDLLRNDAILARVLTRDPLSLLDSDEFIDVDDAVNQVLDFLDKQVLTRVNSSAVTDQQPTPPAQTPNQSSITNPNPKADPVPTPEDQKKESQARQSPMQKITKTIASRINFN